MTTGKILLFNKIALRSKKGKKSWWFEVGCNVLEKIIKFDV